MLGTMIVDRAANKLPVLMLNISRYSVLDREVKCIYVIRNDWATGERPLEKMK